MCSQLKTTIPSGLRLPWEGVALKFQTVMVIYCVMGWTACGPIMNIHVHILKRTLVKLPYSCQTEDVENKNAAEIIFPLPLVLLLTDFYLEKLSCLVVPICI